MTKIDHTRIVMIFVYINRLELLCMLYVRPTDPHYVDALDSPYLSKGDILLVDTNECGRDPCLNEGNCTDAVDDYSCACQTGFIGKRCERCECMVLSNSCNHRPLYG